MAKPTACLTLKKSQIIKATGITLHTFQHWMDRRLIIMSGEDVPGSGKGSPRRFGIRRVYQIAVAHRLALLGIPANIAITLAAKFTDEPQHGRPIGGVFPTGRTILLVSADGTSRVANLQPDASIDALITTDATIVVDIGAILNNIHSRLDMFN
jgi:hypothetical protein